MSKILKRQAKLRLVRRSVLRDFAEFSQTCIASTLSPQLLLKRKTVLSFVVVDPGKRVVWSELFFFPKPLTVSEELFTRSISERRYATKTRNAKNQSGLGSPPCVAAEIRANCLTPVQQTAVSDCRPSQRPPDSLFLLSSTAEGLLSPCSRKAEVLAFRGVTKD